MDVATYQEEQFRSFPSLADGQPTIASEYTKRASYTRVTGAIGPAVDPQWRADAPSSAVVRGRVDRHPKRS